MTVVNNDTAQAVTLPKGTMFVAPNGAKFATAFAMTVPAATKKVGANGKPIIVSSEQNIWVNATSKGKASVISKPKPYTVQGLIGPEASSLVYGIGTLVTILMSNDATAVVLTPAILAAVRKAKVPPLPYLFACALIANAASFVLPISNPANLVVFHDGMPPLAQWLRSFGMPSVLSILTTYAVMRVIFRADLRGPTHLEEGSKVLNRDGKIVLGGLALMVPVLMAASAYGKDLGLPTFLGALAITAVVSIKARSNPIGLAKEISWGTLALVAGLFIMVDAVRSIGALRLTTAALRWAEHLPAVPGALLTSFTVGIGNNIVNNLPLGLLAGATLQAAHTHGLMADAILIGVDLGPNLSVTGSLATILWLIALRKEKLNVSFWNFLKVGAIAMPCALLVSMAAAILLQLLLKPS